MALFERKRKELEAAVRELEGSPSPQGFAAVIEKYVAAGAPDRAQDLARRAKEKYPNSERIQQALMNVVRLQRQEEIRRLQKAVAESPMQPTFERLASIYLVDLGNKTKAQEVAVAGLEKFPQSDGLHLAIGQIRLERFLADRQANDFQEARGALQKAREINGRNFKAGLLLGRLMAEAGQYQAASKILEPLAAESGDQHTEALLAIVRKHAGAADADVDATLRDIEFENRWPPGHEEVHRVFEEAATLPRLDAGVVRAFLDGLARLDGFRAATVVAPDGKIVGARGKSITEGEQFAATVHRIVREVDDATARMDIGSFVTGEVKAGADTLYLAECRTTGFGLLMGQGARRAESADAVERFIAMADEG